MDERKIAWKIIKENEDEKQRRVEQKEAERIEAQKLIADAIKHSELQD